MFQALEAKLEVVWEDLTTDARADLQKALADAKAEIATAEPILTEFKTGLDALLASAEPQLKADAGALLAKLLADFGPLLGTAASGM